MGRYVGNKWHNELPSLSPADQIQGNHEPVQAPTQSGGGNYVAPNTGGGGGGPYYQTKNGLQTLASMEQQLRALGWPGGEDVATAYARTTGSQVISPGAGAGGGGGGGAGGGVNPRVPAEFYNNNAEMLKLQAAQQAAYQAYLNERLRTIDQPGVEIQKEQLALNKATEAFNEAMKTAEITGQYKGQPTEQAREFNAANALQRAGLMGFDEQGRPTEAAKEFARQIALQENIAAGTINGQPTEQAREFNVGQQNQVAMGLLNLLGTLRGPENAFQEQSVVQGMNNSGLSRAVDTLRGFGNQPLSQGNQAAPSPVSLSNLIDRAAGAGLGNNTGTGTGGAFAAPNTAGGSGGGGLGGAYRSALPSPNQIVGRNFLRMDPDTQNFLMSAYNSAGYGTPQVQSAIKAGLPQFKAPTTGTAVL